VGEKRRASGAKAGVKKAKTDEKSPTRELLPLMTGGEMRGYQVRGRRSADTWQAARRRAARRQSPAAAI